MKLKRFKFEVWTTGGGYECFSYWSEYFSEGATKEEATKKLAKELGCSMGWLEEGEYCKITELSNEKETTVQSNS